GAASMGGLGNFFSIMAIISINLALINLIPVPALDGGRLLFVIIESIVRRPIKPSIAHTINAVGFALLVLLMAVVTVHDIFRIVG
ncbi:MAG: site-2 protease family protein, partial [bacterium]|nr:site-2 protease family protein [bacterium]